MPNRWRLILHGAGSAAWNMAVDEALVTIHAQGQTLPALRFYEWAPPAISLGYFQRKLDISSAVLEHWGLQLVRRITGGRAVLHYGDLTYSIVGQSGKDAPSGVNASYQYLCQGLLAGFSRLGIEAGFGYEKVGRKAPGSCFTVASPGDIVWQQKKFVGSAQRRFGEYILQHGSILRKSQQPILKSVFASDESDIGEILEEKVTCIENILGRECSREEIIEAITTGFAETLNIEFIEAEMDEAELELALKLLEKY